jgi:hypothetical protein
MGTLPGQTGGVYHFWALRIRRTKAPPPLSSGRYSNFQMLSAASWWAVVAQSFALSPRDFIEGAAALVFFGGLAFGFLTSLEERFCPLAIGNTLDELDSRTDPLAP